MTSKGERGPSMGINGELDHKIEQPQNGVEEETVSKSGVEGGQDLSRSYSVSSHNTETSFGTAETHIPSVSPHDSRPQQGKREDPRVVAEEETIVFPTEIRITPSPEPVPAYPSKAQNTPHQNISHHNMMDQNVTPVNNVDRDRRQTLRPPPLTLSRSSPITPISSAPSSASPTKLEYDALSSGSSSPTTPQKPHHHISNSSDNTIQIFPPLLSSDPYNPSDISPSNRLGLTMERERQKRGVRVGVGEWERERERPEREAPILRERARERREVSFIPSPEMTGRQDGNGSGNGTAAKTGGLVLKKALEKGMKIADSLAGAASSSSSPTEFVEGERERERGRHVDYTSGKPLPPLPPYARAHDSYHSHPPSSYTYTPPKSHSLPIHSLQGPNPYFPLSEAQPSSRPTSFPPVPPSSHFNTLPSHNTDARVAPFLFQPSASPSGSGSVTEGGKGSGVRRRFSLRALFGREKDKEKGKGKMVETGGRRLVMSSEDYNAL
ncbi:hypothetical protein BT69DRAFT_62926 [Atractiella rhizophila]|nr:hypothetical protein BT69DRAFT_62926 [Atractiella rhizophila]